MIKIFSGPGFAGLLILLACHFLFLPPVQAEDCDCSFFQKSLGKAERLFLERLDLPERDAGAFLAQCVDKSSPAPDPSHDYCVALSAAKSKSRLREIRDREIKRIKALLTGCRDAGKRCAGRKQNLMEQCSALRGPERPRCFLEKNLWEEYRGRFPEEAEDFSRKRKEETENIRSFLYAKKNVCDRKYRENAPRKKLCLSNFKKKYHITDIPALSAGHGGAYAVRGARAKDGREAKNKKEGKDLDSLVEGKWRSREAGCILEFQKHAGVFHIKCLVGCGKEERFTWNRGFNFTRKYSKSNRMGTGAFRETCIFDEKIKEFRCDGMVKYRTKFGNEDLRRLETRHYRKMMKF